jgi:hypothetical protein
MLRGITKYVGRHSIAFLALFVALGGTSFAAANFINGKQIKPGSIPKNRLTNSAIRQLKGAKGAQGPPGQRGATGPQGIQGIQGIPGTPGANGVAKAYARVGPNGQLDAANSKGITSVTAAGTSLLCFNLGGFKPSSVVATIEAYSADAGHTNAAYGTIVGGRYVNSIASCPAGTDAYTATSDLTGASARYPVYVIFN